MITEAFADRLLDIRQRGPHLVHQTGRQLPPVGVVVVADFGGNRESGRHGQPDVGHFSEVCALAAKQVAQTCVALAEEPDAFFSCHTQVVTSVTQSARSYTAALCQEVSAPGAWMAPGDLTSTLRGPPFRPR